MAVGAAALQLLRVLGPISFIPTLFLPAGLLAPARAEPAMVRVPELRPFQEAAREVALAEERLAFSKESAAVALSEVRRAREEDRIRFDEEVRRGEAIRQEALVREELRQIEAVNARRRELELRIDADREAREFEAQARAEEAQLGALVRLQAAKADQFRAFSQALAPGFIPVVTPIGQFTSIAPGGTLTPEDLRRGLEPLPFQRTIPTAERLAQVPGVFIGPEFRFKSIEQASDFFVSSRLKARAPFAAPRVSGLF